MWGVTENNQVFLENIERERVTRSEAEGKKDSVEPKVGDRL